MIHRHSLIDATLFVNEEGVERTGPGRAPSAFRIWRAGENRSDEGSCFFTEASATLLLEEQASRARPYSIDFDHLSLVDDRPAEAGRAAGWHRLETRETPAGPELWAVDLEWCADVRAGLEEKPPRWRFFSPAFRVDEGRAVTSYVNLALCINPMTHGIPLLASTTVRKESTMTAEEMLSLLDSIIAATEDPDQKAALVAAREALAAKNGADKPPESESGETATAADKKDDDAETKSDGGDDTDDDDKKKDDKPDTKATKAHAAKAAADPVAALTAQVLTLARKVEISDIDIELAKHPNLPEEFKTHCRSKSLGDAKALISVVGVKKHATRKTSPTQGGDGSAAIDPRVGDDMDRQMGVKARQPRLPQKMSDGTLVMHNVRPSDLARLNAQKEKV